MQHCVKREWDMSSLKSYLSAMEIKIQAKIKHNTVKICSHWTLCSHSYWFRIETFLHLNFIRGFLAWLWKSKSTKLKLNTGIHVATKEKWPQTQITLISINISWVPIHISFKFRSYSNFWDDTAPIHREYNFLVYFYLII